eukprot:g19794.t1
MVKNLCSRPTSSILVQNDNCKKSRWSLRTLDSVQTRTLIAEGKEGFAYFFFFIVLQHGRRFVKLELDLLELKHRGLSREGIQVLSNAGRVLPLRSFDRQRSTRLQEIKEKLRQRGHSVQGITLAAERRRENAARYKLYTVDSNIYKRMFKAVYDQSGGFGHLKNWDSQDEMKG